MKKPRPLSNTRPVILSSEFSKMQECDGQTNPTTTRVAILKRCRHLKSWKRLSTVFS